MNRKKSNKKTTLKNKKIDLNKQNNKVITKNQNTVSKKIEKKKNIKKNSKNIKKDFKKTNLKPKKTSYSKNKSEKENNDKKNKLNFKNKKAAKSCELFEKNPVQDNSKEVLDKIFRLENIHKARKEQQMLSDKIAFWIFLIISIITNFSLSFIIIFLIVFLQDPLIYLLIAIIGFSFGMFYSYMINNMRYSLFYYHAFSKIFILITGTINIIYIIITSSIIYNFLGFKGSTYNFLGISLTYFFFYLLPYFIDLFYKKYFY